VNDANNVPPSVSYALDPTAATGENGWYAGDVSLTWTIENLTDPSIVSGCEDQTITADQIMTLYTCYASTAAGASGTVEVQIGRDTTAPHVTVTGVLDGAEYIEDAVPAAGCATTDATAGVQTEATADTSGGPLGLVTVTCSGGEDNAGNVAANVVITYTVTSTSESTDTTPPQIVPVITPATPTGDNGWYTGPVSFYWNVTEPESPESVVVTGCVGASYIGDLTMHSFSCSASSDGGTAPTMTINIGLDQTAPVVSVTDVTDGATYTALPTPGCTTTDAVSGVATDATLSITGGPTGTVTATCSGAKDNAGNIGSASATYTVQTVDTTPPIIVPTVNGTLGTSGWYTSDVEVSWSVVDDESDISASTGCDATTVVADTTGTTLTCEATSEGGTNSESVTIKRDATAPVVTVTGVENGATYTQGSVPAAGCSTTDATSGVETNAHVSITGGPLGSVTAMCLGAKDNAGNSAGAVSATYMILAADSTAPVIDYVLNPTTPSGLHGWYTGNVTLTWTVIDTETPDTVSQVGCANQTITADQVKATYSCSATSDGGTAAQVNVVIGRDATPPVVTVTGVTNDASYAYGAVPTAGCTTSDATSGVATQATISLTGGPLGSVTAQCLGATDNAGNANAAVVTYTVTDGTPPVVTYTLTPSTPTGENGWYTSNISLTWTVVENESPESLNTYGCVDRTFAADQAKVTYFCQAVSPGGDSGAVSVDVGRDTTPPQVGVTGVADGATYIYGQVPTAGCSTTDATSGVATNATLSMIGGPLGQVTARCAGAMDNAGHTSSAGVTFTVLDDTSPDITPSIIGTIGANGWYISDVTLTWTVTDTDTPDTVQVTGCDDQTITADQIKTSYSCTATSEGGTTGPVEVTIGRDATAPIAAVTGVEDGATYLYEHVPALGCTTTDSTSGVQTAATISTSGGPVGEITATCAGAVDNAGNVSSASLTYTVHYDWQGFVSTTDDRRGPRKTLAGMPVTVVFMINGNVGLDAVESITTIACNAAPGTQPTPAASQGRREPLQQGSANTFIFRWQTTRSMAGTCQELRVTLADGTTWSQTYQFQR